MLKVILSFIITIILLAGIVGALLSKDGGGGCDLKLTFNSLEGKCSSNPTKPTPKSTVPETFTNNDTVKPSTIPSIPAPLIKGESINSKNISSVRQELEGKK